MTFELRSSRIAVSQGTSEEQRASAEETEGTWCISPEVGEISIPGAPVK